MKQPEYLSQTEGSCCDLFALCNAARYFGFDTPAPGQPEWEKLVDLAACRHGSTIHRNKVADALGLKLVGIERSDDLFFEPPTMWAIENPDPLGMYGHCCLFIGKDDHSYRLVNYLVGGPVVESVPISSIGWLPDHAYSQHHIKLKEGSSG